MKINIELHSMALDPCSSVQALTLYTSLGVVEAAVEGLVGEVVGSEGILKSIQKMAV
jgi:hypothetical protein